MLVSPPADPTPEPFIPISKLPFPKDDATYNEHLQRKKCNLLSGTNTLATVRLIYKLLD